MHYSVLYKYKKYRNKSWLYQKLFVEEMTVREIAEIEGVGNVVIYYWINHKHKLREELVEYKKKEYKKEYKTKRFKNWLKDEAFKGTSVRRMAKNSGLSTTLINYWMIKYEIKRKYPIGEIYLVKEEDTSFYKIGKSKIGGIANRIQTIQVHNPRKIILVKSITVPDYGNIEMELHSLFSSQFVSGEWFNFNSEELVSVKQKMDVIVNEKIKKV